jgi:hypothetical protein
VDVVSNKYGAIPSHLDGLRFDSQAEARRYQELKLMQAAGEIEHLECQPCFPLVVNGVKVGSYIADFTYWQGGRRVVEDVKGVRTQVYALKKRLVEALYGIKVVEVQA